MKDFKTILKTKSDVIIGTTVLAVLGVLAATFLIQSFTKPMIDDEVLRSVRSTETSEDREQANYQQTENNIAFDVPDLMVTMETTSGLSGEFHIEAYKSVSNDNILQDEGQLLTKKVSKLIWVSAGQPMLVKTKMSGAKEEKLFHLSTNGFYTYIQMLTPAHRGMLVTAANFKYSINIGENQIVNLILSRFECNLVLYDDADNKYLLRGNVIDFRRFPLRMDFMAPRKSVERKLFLEELKSSEDGADIRLTCTMASRGKVMKTKILSIATEQMEQIGIVEKLFGTSSLINDVYITRGQAADLASEMYPILNIVEDYQMPEMQFSEAFVEGLINQAATSHFTITPVDTVVASLSSYALGISEDLKPEVIKRDLGRIFKVADRGGKRRIVLSDEYTSIILNSSEVSDGISRGVSWFRASVNFGRNNANSSEAERKSLNEQLNELNAVSRKEVKWEFEGHRLVPTSLNVARLTRSKLSKTLHFNRVRIQSFSASFEREFGLYTHQFEYSLPLFEKLNTQLTKELNMVKEVLNTSVTQLIGSTNALNQSITETQNVTAILSSQTVKRCRVCLQTANTCYSRSTQTQTSCSGWSDNPTSWTTPYYDYSGNSYHCVLYWNLECQK